MAIKKTTRSSWVELNWKPLLDRFDKSWLRRSKTILKQGAISELQCQDGRIEAQVKNGTMPGVYQVSFPAVSWWEPYRNQVAVWLSSRPEWLASLLNQSWPSEFLEFVESSRLRVFPDTESADFMLTHATCTCTDMESPCRHILATVFYLIEEQERDPLQSLELVGVNVRELLDQAHTHSAYRFRNSLEITSQQHSKTSKLPVFPLEVWPEEALTWFGEGEQKESGNRTPWFRVAPEVDPNKAKREKEVYNAWK